jgi:methylglyoxal synthase
MQYKYINSNANKSIALVAHDNMKKDLIEWCQTDEQKLSSHQLYATGTTGQLLTKLTISKLISGPLEGDQKKCGGLPLISYRY